MRGICVYCTLLYFVSKWVERIVFEDDGSNWHCSEALLSLTALVPFCLIMHTRVHVSSAGRSLIFKF
jgi:hypothetical protein